MVTYDSLFGDIEENAEYYAELTTLRAQEHIATLMKQQSINRADLARMLGKSKAYVTRMLSDGYNMTMKTYASVLYHLGHEAHFQSQPIQNEQATTFTFKQPKFNINTVMTFSGLAI